MEPVVFSPSADAPDNSELQVRCTPLSFWTLPFAYRADVSAQAPTTAGSETSRSNAPSFGRGQLQGYGELLTG